MSRRFWADSSSLASALKMPLDAAIDVAGSREPLNGGDLGLDRGGKLAGVGERVEAADRPHVAALELVDLAHQLGVRDDVVAGAGVDGAS